MDFLLRWIGGLFRFVGRLIGLALALALVATLFVFFLAWLMLRLLFGRRANVKVSAHFDSMASFKDLSQRVMRRGNWPARPGAAPDEPGLLSRHGPGKVEDVQARDLPADRR